MYSEIVLRTDIDHLVVKRNELVVSHGYLTEGENNLILLAIILTRLYAKNKEREFNLDSTIRVSVNDYMTIFGVSRNTAYNALNSSINNLYDRSFTLDENGIKVDYRWLVSKAKKEPTSVSDGFIEFQFSKKAIQMIVDFDHDQGRYTAYGIERVSRLKGRFSGKIYELAMESKNKAVRQTRVYEFEELRAILGIDPEQYRDTRGRDKTIPKVELPTRFDNFRKEVLDRSVETINLESDIIIKYHTFKKSGRICGVAFSFYFKPDYVPKFHQNILPPVADNKEGEITVGDETKKPPKTKPKTSKKSKGSAPTSDTSTQSFLDTDLRPEDIDECVGSNLAIGYEKSKPKEYNEFRPADHMFTSYAKLGGTLSIEEIEEQCRSLNMAAAHYMLAEMSRLRQQK